MDKKELPRLEDVISVVFWEGHGNLPLLEAAKQRTKIRREDMSLREAVQVVINHMKTDAKVEAIRPYITMLELSLKASDGRMEDPIQVRDHGEVDKSLKLELKRKQVEEENRMRAEEGYATTMIQILGGIFGATSGDMVMTEITSAMPLGAKTILGDDQVYIREERGLVFSQEETDKVKALRQERDVTR